MELHKKFITTLVSSITTSCLYSTGHPQVKKLLHLALAVLSDIFKHEESLEIMLVADDLVLNRKPLRGAGSRGEHLKKWLKEKGVSRVDILAGITIGELTSFAYELSDKSVGFRSYGHVKTGVVDVDTTTIFRVDSETSLPADSQVENIDQLKELLHAITPFKRLSATGLQEIVANFISTLKREAHVLQLISPVKSDSEFTYTHAANVSMLSMFQAESLGMSGNMLHEIGTAALLHDVGKLFIPNEILNKKGQLTDEEFREITRHTVEGAKYLARMDDVTCLAPIVAFEHHLGYDLSGYPALNGMLTRQHPASQLVQIADVFDSLRSKRPYKQDWTTKDILALMRENAGKDFNPNLVDHFVKLIGQALAE